MTPPLEAAWRDLAARAGLPGPDAAEVYADLCRRYGEPGRAYHTLDHVAALLKTLDEFPGRVNDEVAVRLAVWLHDAVYDTRRDDNEAQSAAYARAVLGGAAEPHGRRVQELVEATKTHHPPPGDGDCRLLLDADLAVLGAAPDDYNRYAQAIRTEYLWVPEADYQAGRTRVLQSFLGRERLYQTDWAFEQWEQAARTNLRREIETLGSTGHA